MPNANQRDKNRLVVVGGLALTEQPAGQCPIASGDSGYWNDAGVVKFRESGGTDVPTGGAYGAQIVRVHAVSTSALAANTYANGTAGVGATLTGNANGAFETVDGVAAALNNIYLVTGEATGANNGAYKLTTLGTGSTVYVLTRIEEFDESAEIDDGTPFLVRGGTTNADTTWKYDGADGPTVGTTSLTFSRDPGVLTTNTAQTVTAVKTYSSAPAFTKEANYSVAVGTSTTSNTAGGNLGYVAGAGVGSGAGGTMSNTGGAGGATGAGGPANNVGGAGGATSGTGGAAVNQGGVGTAGNSAGGAASNIGGAGQGSAAGGAAVSVGGQGGATGVGGAASVTGGAGGATSGTGGAASLVGGAGTAGNANGGDVTVKAGNAHGSGTDGVMYLGTTDTSAINMSVSGILTRNAGNFQVNGTSAVTATVGGGTTGLIPAGASLVIVTSDDANKQISLPAGTVGDVITILVGATGCELIAVTAADKVNDVVVGATNEAALTATNHYVCKYLATNTWVVIGYTKLGAVQAALVPDAL